MVASPLLIADSKVSPSLSDEMTSQGTYSAAESIIQHPDAVMDWLPPQSTIRAESCVEGQKPSFSREIHLGNLLTSRNRHHECMTKQYVTIHKAHQGSQAIPILMEQYGERGYLPLIQNTRILHNSVEVAR